MAGDVTKYDVPWPIRPEYVTIVQIRNGVEIGRTLTFCPMPQAVAHDRYMEGWWRDEMERDRLIREAHNRPKYGKARPT